MTKQYETPDFKEKYAHLLGHIDEIFAVLHEGICISNANGVIVKMNPMYEKLSGLPPKALLGKQVRFLNSREGVFDEPDPNPEEIAQKKGIFMGPVSPLILKNKRPVSSIQQTTGGRKNLLHGYPLLDANGDVELVVTFIRDISYLTLFQEQRIYHDNILEKFHSNNETERDNQPRRPPIIANSASMQEVIELAKKVAKTEATVLILGETGVGKGEVAKLIHAESTRAQNIFFNADCTTIATSLIESELFGYAPGAFSGAQKNGKKGYFEIANNGTIFLDEIGELSLPMQSKLLRVLQDHEVMPVGGTEMRKVNPRIIAATNQNLRQEMMESRFRQDLFYRLHVSVITIPPLRERIEDILPLTSFFLARYNSKYKKSISFSDQSVELLLQHNWPGNIRELQNLIEGLVITKGSGTITPADIPSLATCLLQDQVETIDIRKELEEGKSLKNMISELEDRILRKALEQHGSLTKVAQIFKLDRTTVSRKLRSQKLI